MLSRRICEHAAWMRGSSPCMTKKETRSRKTYACAQIPLPNPPLKGGRGLLALNPHGLRDLILADRSPATAIGLLLFGLFITFGSTAMGTAIMALGGLADSGAGDSGSGGGGGRRRDAPDDNKPLPVRVRAR